VNEMQKRKLILITIVIFLAFASSVISYLFLPEAIEQRNNGTMPKHIYVLIAFTMSIVFSILYYFKNKKKYMLCAILFIVLPLVAILFGNVFYIPLFH